MKKYPWYIVIGAFIFVMIIYVGMQIHSALGEGEAATDESENLESHADHGPPVPVVDEDTRKILYWTCVMHPTVRMQEFGVCPVCRMDLTPVYEGEGLTLTEKQKALIPVKTEKIGFHRLEREIRTVGVLDYNEANVAYASTRVSGWIQKLHVNFTGTKVKEGQHLLDIYSPELLVAQEEYLLAIKNLSEIQSSHIEAIRHSAEGTIRAAESRLELLGLTKEQIQDIQKHGEARTELPLYSPIGGTVIHMNVSNGQHVNRGMNLYRIADLSSIWLLADIYEYEIPWIALGQDVLITVQSMPDQEFHGKVIFIYPYMESKTRTVKVQVEVPNPAGALRPGMYANVRLKSTLAEIYAQKTEHIAHEHEHMQAAPVWTCPMHPQIKQDEPGECPICGMDLIAEEVVSESKAAGIVLRADAPPLQFAYACPDHPDQKFGVPGTCPIDGKQLIMVDEALAVPKSSVINTGLRTIVFVDKGGKAGYVQTEVKLGSESWSNNGSGRRRYFPVISGLFANDIVVTNGNYLLDSQSQLTGSGSAAGAYGGAIGKEEDAAKEVPQQHQH